MSKSETITEKKKKETRKKERNLEHKNQHQLYKLFQIHCHL